MSALYTVLIYPLELFFEVVFSIANRIVSNPGWAIIVLSLAVNFLVLPLYKRADEVQREERELEDSLAEGIDHIKKTFKGDERMMMLQTFYEQNNYSPLFVLKGSVSLLLQIPFFMAAYRFLSNLTILRGVGFGPIHDLGAPDSMFTVAGIGINVLPILMTLINFISGYIYTKDMPLKSKIQLYGMALLFLVLLYNSPSGLAFYWTLNNVFSMLKNVFYRFKRPGFVLACVSSGAGALLILFVNTVYKTYLSRQLRLSVLGLMLMIPLAVILFKNKFFPEVIKGFDISAYTKHDRNIFILSGLFLTALTGVLIPSSVIKSSPSSFVVYTDLQSPNTYVIHAGLIAFGIFVFWGGVFYCLSRERGRLIISRIWWILCPASLVTYLFFGTNLGTLTSTLKFDAQFNYSFTLKALNMFIILLSAVVSLLICRKFPKITEGLALILVAACAVMGIVNMRQIEDAYNRTRDSLILELPSIPLSRDGQNVMVLMIDRAPAYFVPIIFEEIPELETQFDGFVFYPNTLSFGAHTKHATPALFGGYDYTPQLICEDTEKTLRETQDEALTVMPLLFAREGYEVTLLDPPYAGYMSPPDVTVFDAPEYEGIDAYIASGNPMLGSNDFSGSKLHVWQRNFFCYSLLKISPLILQNTVYNQGNYNMADLRDADGMSFSIPQIPLGASAASGVDEGFMKAYSVLSNFESITSIEDGIAGTFMYIDNETAHTTMLLSEPDYVPSQYVDNTEYDNAHADRFDGSINGFAFRMDSYDCMRQYECSVAAYIQLGRYFDYLREQGVWDNTRIIIVSDHGTMNFDAPIFGDSTRLTDYELAAGIEAFNPVLMVKDFGSSGFTVSDELMTNADVPYLATEGIIVDPVNPYTGNPLIMHDDYQYPYYIYDSGDANVTDTVAGADAYRFVEDRWYTFNGETLYDMNSWEYDGVR